ncbi:MAG: serine hydrolase [Elusimicrobia bacterium]|nr:serine hydrolase [Elusimicrobiota bacterium]
MKRLAPLRPSYKISLMDWVVLIVLAMVPFSYYLGLRIDWNQTAEAGLFIPSVPAVYNRAPSASAAAPYARAVEGGETATVATRIVDGTVSEVEQSSWDELTRRLEAEAISFPGRVAIYLKDLKRDRVWAYQADDLFPSASLIKVPIMAAVFQRIRDGGISLQTSLTLRRRHRTGGSGSIKWHRDGARFTVEQLLTKMIDESDNTAAKMLIETVSMEYLQQQFPKQGLVYTEINPEGMSLKNRRVTYENYTTAREMGGLLEKIYRGDMVDRGSSEKMLDLMKHLKHRARLAKGLPPGWEIAHKTGLLRGACHDSAVIFTPQGDLVLTVLTGQNRDYTRAKDFITQLGRIAYRYYGGDQSLYARANAVSLRRLPNSSRHLSSLVD